MEEDPLGLGHKLEWVELHRFLFLIYLPSV